jgi:hypothetical protein
MTGRSKHDTLRRAPRLPIRLLATLMGRSPFEVEVLDLSVRGCLVRSPVRFDRGQIMDFTLTLEGQPLTAKVRVADTSCDGEARLDAASAFLTGLEFLALPPPGDITLAHFLEQARRHQKGGA